MEIHISFAKAIKQKTTNRSWLDYEGIWPLNEEAWIRHLDDLGSFEHWIMIRFSAEHINKRDFRYLNQTVLVVAVGGDLGSYLFFDANGELAQLYREGRLDDLYEEFRREAHRE